jgi:hypothetical protein
MSNSAMNLRLNDDYTKLKEYLFRQDLYKKSLIN